ncbi:MAG TPA: type II secretion system protein [Candidatus Manganitrophaceae bacterium]|nr:type II secretion system protein [Candidatus Manganitrophaceae bacterium]
MTVSPRAGRPFPSNQHGFTFLAIMFSIVLIGTTIGAAARQWKTVVQREKEAELLFRGQAIKRAIDFYYRTSRAGFAQYPRTLEELLKDPGSPAVRRYLRKIYPDPMTRGDWVLIKDGSGRVKGVHSASEEAPLKRANFPEEFKSFEGKKKYSEWVFESKPEALPGGGIPGTIPVPPPTPTPLPPPTP